MELPNTQAHTYEDTHTHTHTYTKKVGKVGGKKERKEKKRGFRVLRQRGPVKPGDLKNEWE